MSDDYRKRIESILLKQAAKQLKPKVKRQKNKSPEKWVEKECVEWMRSMGFDIAIYEAKAVWNKSANRFMANQSVKAGTCDCIGTTNEGIGVFVEFKAKGKLKTFSRLTNGAQREFLISKIKHGAFACVVDSAESLRRIYELWKIERTASLDKAKAFLLERLPKAKLDVNSDSLEGLC